MFFDGEEFTTIAVILCNLGFISTFFAGLLFFKGEDFGFILAVIMAFCTGSLGFIAVMTVLAMVQYIPIMFVFITILIVISAGVWKLSDNRMARND